MNGSSSPPSAPAATWRGLLHVAAVAAALLLAEDVLGLLLVAPVLRDARVVARQILHRKACARGAEHHAQHEHQKDRQP